MKFSIEDAINRILRNNQDFKGDNKDDFYIGVKRTFDNAPLGVDINIKWQEEKHLPWTAVAYPLIEVRNEILTPDYGNSLLGFNFRFTNNKKNELEIQAFYTNNGESNSEAWYSRTKLNSSPPP